MNENKLKTILFILILILIGFGIYTAYIDNGPKNQKPMEVNLV